MPKSIYLNLLPEVVQKVVGVVDTSAEPAATLLKKKVFVIVGYVDIFDVGLYYRPF